MVDKILHSFKRNEYTVTDKEDEINICYIEGANEDLSPNGNIPNAFNDRRIVFGVRDSKWKILGNWEATTEPGRYFTEVKPNTLGAARIAFGQYSAWSVGIHRKGSKSAHEALVQTALVKIYRDLNKDYKRKGDTAYVGMYGINQHHGFDVSIEDIKNTSAGCLVGRTVKGHQEFMELVKSDARYKTDAQFKFSTTVLSVTQLSTVQS